MTEGRLATNYPRFALIVGGMKCGTTSLFQYLADHPAVCPSRPKEPHFFSHDEHWEKGIGWYEEKWDWDPAQHEIALEGSTGYTKQNLYPDAAARIGSLDADVRLIYVVRDPFARIESHIRHAMSQPWGGRVTIEPGRVPDHQIDVSDYASQISTLHAALPDHPLLVLSFEDLIEDPDNTLFRVCRFLGISEAHTFGGLGRAHNRSDRKRVMHPFWQRLGRNKERAWISKWARVANRVGLGRLFWTTRRPAFRLDADQRAYIHDRLAPGMARLRDDHDIDVAAWGFE